jgi:hypothetical protein
MVVSVGCTTASIEQTWRAPDAATLTHVVTLSPVSDPTTRRSAEDQLAAQLSRHGVRATPAYAILTYQDRNDKRRIASVLAAQGFDGIVSMRLVGVHQQLEYYPGFDAYWGGAWGSVVPETVVRVAISAYSLPSKQLVWSATSKSVDPNSVPQVIGDVSKVATDRLARDHVIGPARAATR